MRKGLSRVACLLLALCFIPLTALADENEVWWSSAKAEAEREGYRLIDGIMLQERIAAGDKILIIDARADYEFAAGHITGATNLEFDLGDRMNLSADKREAFRQLAGPDKKRTLIIYCRSFR